MKQTIEATKSTMPPLEADIEELEAAGAIADSLDFAHYYFRSDRMNTPGVRDMSQDEITKKHFKSFLLPDIPGGEGKLDTIREVNLGENFYPPAISGERSFLKVPQGVMYAAPCREKPYFYLTMSTCSTIIGYGAEEITVAHISYSFEDQTDAVMAHMQESGVTPDNIFVVASLGDKPTWRSEPTLSAGEDYVRWGIKPENILPFSSAGEDGTTIAEVVISEHGLRVGLSPLINTSELGDEQAWHYIVRDIDKVAT